MKRKKAMYKNIIFDLYGTLIDLYTNEDNMELWEKMSYYYGYKGAVYLPEELKEQYILSCKEEIIKIKDTDYPDIDIYNVFEQLYLKKNIKPEKSIVEESAAVFRMLSTEKIELYDGVIELLQYLKKSEKRVILLSNAQRLFTLNEMKYMGILDYFDSLFISSDYKVSKPDSKFYKAMIEKEKIDIKESLMVGNDHTTDIAGALNIGMDSVYIHTNHSRKSVKENNIDIKSNLIILDGDIKKLTEWLQ